MLRGLLTSAEPLVDVFVEPKEDIDVVGRYGGYSKSLNYRDGELRPKSFVWFF